MPPVGLEAAGARDGRPERGGARLEGRAVLPLPARLVRLVPSLHCRVPHGLGSQKLRNIQLAAFSVSTRIALFLIPLHQKLTIKKLVKFQRKS